MKKIAFFKANHGGIKGRLPNEMVNQDPMTSSSQREREGGDEDEDNEDEGDEPRTPERNTEEVLNESDDDDDGVSISMFSVQRSDGPVRDRSKLMHFMLLLVV